MFNFKEEVLNKKLFRQKFSIRPRLPIRSYVEGFEVNGGFCLPAWRREELRRLSIDFTWTTKIGRRDATKLRATLEGVDFCFLGCGGDTPYRAARGLILRPNEI